MKRIACFGEVLLRLAPSAGASLRQAAALEVHVGGAEANVAVGLQQLGHRARLITVLPDLALGDLARRRLAAERIDLDHCISGPGRMGLYFHEAAAGPRAASVTYDRAGSAFALAGASAYRFAAALEGVDHLHVSGISPAVSAAAADATAALLQAACKQGCTISFDGNFRASLWAASGREARAVLAPLVEAAQIMFGNCRDAGLLLGREFPAERPREAAEAMFAAFPRLRLLVATDRQGQAVTARVDRPEVGIASAPCVLDTSGERIGTGDAFVAGFLAAHLSGSDDAVSLRSALAAMAVKAAQKGDLPDLLPADLTAAGGDIVR